MRYVISISLLIAAIIHLLPVTGLAGGTRLNLLYGLDFGESNLAILMRHRAVLFGLLGVFLVYAAFKPAVQTSAFVGALISVISFIWLARSVGGYNAHIARVVAADIIALIALVLGCAAHVYALVRDAPATP